jgi:serine/threonine protein kinase
MDHPNIANVHDAGSTDAGRPYFVMELVRGVPITEYCDTNNVATADRLTLFTYVGRAVQHAHQKGIIHRDLEPRQCTWPGASHLVRSAAQWAKSNQSIAPAVLMPLNTSLASLRRGSSLP